MAKVVSGGIFCVHLSPILILRLIPHSGNTQARWGASSPAPVVPMETAKCQSICLCVIAKNHRPCVSWVPHVNIESHPLPSWAPHQPVPVPDPPHFHPSAQAEVGDFSALQPPSPRWFSICAAGSLIAERVITLSWKKYKTWLLWVSASEIRLWSQLGRIGVSIRIFRNTQAGWVQGAKELSVTTFIWHTVMMLS